VDTREDDVVIVGAGSGSVSVAGMLVDAGVVLGWWRASSSVAGVRMSRLCRARACCGLRERGPKRRNLSSIPDLPRGIHTRLPACTRPISLRAANRERRPRDRDGDPTTGLGAWLPSSRESLRWRAS